MDSHRPQTARHGAKVSIPATRGADPVSEAPSVDWRAGRMEDHALEVVPPELRRRLEAHELRIWISMHEASSEATRRGLGLSVKTIGRGTFFAASRWESLAANRVLGLTRAGGPSADDVSALRRVAADLGVARLMVTAPPPVARGLDTRLRGAGLRPHTRWVRLYQRIEPARVAMVMPLVIPPVIPSAIPPAAVRGSEPGIDAPISIEPAGASDADAFAAVLAAAFEWPLEVGQWPAQSIGRNGWRHYIARSGCEAVAVAGLHILDDLGWLGFGATLPAWRGRGLQQALYTRRVLDAVGSGCRHVHVETAEDRPGRRVSSFRNALRAGFRPLYARPNYLVELGDPAA